MHHSFYKPKHRQVRPASANHCNIAAVNQYSRTCIFKPKATLGRDPSLGQRCWKGQKNADSVCILLNCSRRDQSVGWWERHAGKLPFILLSQTPTSGLPVLGTRKWGLSPNKGHPPASISFPWSAVKSSQLTTERNRLLE